LRLSDKTEDSQVRWELRRNRARELESEHSSNRSALRLYGEILGLQAELARGLCQVIDPSKLLREQIDLDALCSMMPSVLSLAANVGPDLLRIAANELANAGEGRWRRLLESALIPGECALPGSDDFFTRVCLQPVAEHLQLQLPKDANYNHAVCPACGGLPQVAVLRPEGEGARRSLLCSFCLCEWAFRRVLCPWCGEEDKGKLPRYSAADCAYVHVEACDTCQHYVKAVDMTINGHAVPVVDEVALAVLDVWANEHGYTKIRQNLLGL
jgi:FdhE protein